MTMTRVSMVFAAEGYMDSGSNAVSENTVSNFGKGRGFYKTRRLTNGDGYKSVKCPWVHAPTGTFIGNDHNRQANPIRAMGTKKWDTVQYGAFTGSFNWTFTLDYEYLHALTFLFEGYKETVDENGTVTYSFVKEDYSRIKSFTVIRTILNRMTGGGQDEAEQFLGCVAKNFTISRSAGTSSVSVTITGFYVSERMFLGDLNSTDYDENSGELAEYMCMFISDTAGADLTDMDYVANTESLSIGIDNNADKIYNTCSPYASSYFEGQTDYKLSTTCYSNNPANYKQRLYGGGEIVRPALGGKVIVPRAKKLGPLKQITLLTHDMESATPENINAITKEDFIQAYNNADRKMRIDIDDMIIKSLNWSKSEGQKMTDNISSAECNEIKITFQALESKDMGSFDLFVDANNEPKVKHKCDSPVVDSEAGLEW